MESSNHPTVPKRLWHIMQLVYYMFRKNISKRRLILDIHLLLKRSKLAGKALGNLLTTIHHHHRHHHHFPTIPNEVEFSCNNTPSFAYTYFFATPKRKTGRRHRWNDSDILDAAEMAMAFQMMYVEEYSHEEPVPPSPTLSTPSPMMMRQLRITDSPFPINENEVMDAEMINKEADKFIKMFYEQLRRQQLAS